jgi:hypothetical protein
MPRYSQGDRVIVRPDLEENTHYYMDDQGLGFSLPAIDDMLKLAASEVTIKDINSYLSNSYYRIGECDYGWTDEMFLGLADEVSDQPDFEPSDMSLEELLFSEIALAI